MLHFSDLAWLGENRLYELQKVQERARNSPALFAEGIALQGLLNRQRKRLPKGCLKETTSWNVSVSPWTVPSRVGYCRPNKISGQEP
jgi:hypothetical protein